MRIRGKLQTKLIDMAGGSIIDVYAVSGYSGESGAIGIFGFFRYKRLLRLFRNKWLLRY